MSGTRIRQFEIGKAYYATPFQEEQNEDETRI